MIINSRSRTLRGSTLLTSAVVLIPAASLFAACGTPPGNAPPGGNHFGFDSGAGHDSGKKPDATSHHDAGTDTGIDTGMAGDGGGTGAACTNGSMCTSGVCKSEMDGSKLDGGGCEGLGCTCQAPSCTDGVKNQGETDIDCGGNICNPCPDGDTCNKGTDCVDKVCGFDNGCGTDAGVGACVCEAPTCTDGVQNESETAVDCGGPHCPKCTTGKGCVAPSDCISDVCSMGSGGGPSLCSCPTGMIEATTSLMIPYCIDAYEVTKAQYQTFLDQNILPSTQPAECMWNTTFAPANNFPPLPEWAPNPITNVNWCDAYMYCASTGGKHLCGHIVASGIDEGAPINQTNGDANVATADEWYNACSDQGANTYPYGSTYTAGFCNGAESAAQTGLEWQCAQTSPTQQCCNSITPGFPSPYPTVQQGETLDGFAAGSCVSPPNFREALCIGGVVNTLFDMSGNVSEWENSCSATTGMSDTCNVRGGSYKSAQSAMTCKNTNQAPIARNTTADDVGFRCCL
jgi:formylglycine-generating enzyme required for sulfatase activity